MSKVADNERIKLAATYMNNIAVGVLLAGFFVPYVALLQKMPDNPQLWLGGKPTVVDVLRVVALLVTIFLAVGVSFYLHREALRLPGKLRD
jgi:hypothetical protein